MKLNSIYISVRNMGRAVEFYEDVFGVEAAKDRRMSTIDLGNITLLLYNPEADGEQAKYGNNVVPCVETDDIGQALSILEKWNCKIVMGPEEVDGYILVQAEDPEGNVIEFYQTKKK